MQALVYTFIALAACALAATAYFGLAFSPVEALMLAMLAAGLAVIYMERQLRRRSEARLERAVEELSRLLATDAQAGQVLSQRINALTDVDAGKRLSGLEADISVLGTVVRQVAEAVSDLEQAQEEEREAQKGPMVLSATARAVPEALPEPDIDLSIVEDALSEGRILFHIEPIFTLPQRRVHGYDLTPRMRMDGGDIAAASEFMPVRGGESVIRRIEIMAAEEAVTLLHRARANKSTLTLYVPLSRATLGDVPAVNQISALLEANRGTVPVINFAISEDDWRACTSAERQALAAMMRRGAAYSIVNARSLRSDFSELSALGVRSVRVDATRFVEQPGAFTDIHTSDIASFVERSGIDLMAMGIRSEDQIISLLEDGFGYAQGYYMASAGPIRPDLVGDRLAPVA